jgi:isopentenyl diphosphate isomerase/L-lactate dehydrogenase-like FMN-dependent dehydrogenase
MLDVLTTTEIVQHAHATLTPEIWDFIAGGAETETTVWRNRKAIAALAFRARVLRNVVSIDTTATLLGAKLRIPFILAPCGNLEDVTPDGAAAGARAAARFGTLHVCSSVSQPGLEAVAAASGEDRWFQLYLRGDRDWKREQIGRIDAAGYRALVITVDSAYYGNRERQVLRRWVPPGRVGRLADGRADFPKMVDWETIDDIRTMTSLPLVIKGIQTGEDAALALEHGVAAVWISNHGGRQLDCCRGTLDVLPEVVQAVARRVPIIIDGGFRRATDAIKALALGASAVALGRLYAVALGAAGDEGVVRMLEILEGEMKTAMGGIGAASVGQLDATYVARDEAPPTLSAFPLGEVTI